MPVRERNGSAISFGGSVDMLNKELETHIASIDGKVSSDHPLAHPRPASSHTFKVVFGNQNCFGGRCPKTESYNPKSKFEP